MSAKKEPKTLSLHDYFKKYEIFIGILVTLSVTKYDVFLKKSDDEIKGATDNGKMLVRMDHAETAINNLNHAVFHY